MESNNQSFWQFSDQLRLQNANFANLSLNDSIWSVNDHSTSKPPVTRRNFDVRVGGELLNNTTTTTNSFLNNKTPTPTTPTTPNYNHFNPNNNNNYSPSSYDYKHRNGSSTPTNDYNNAFNDTWKLGSGLNTPNFSLPPPTPNNNNNFIDAAAAVFNTKDNLYAKPYSNQLFNNNSNTNNFNLGVKGYYNTKFDHFKTNLVNEDTNLYSPHHQYHKTGKNKKDNNGKKKDNGSNNSNNNGKDNDGTRNGTDKRFKTLPPSEALPRNETIGGYIFVCNNDTMEENLKRQLFGLPPRYRDSVRAITPGLPLFLYNYSTHQLHGIYEAASFGGTNLDATAWEDKKNPGESRFPAQVRVQTRKVCDPLDEDAFRPILHHYDGPKFRLELSIPEAISLLDIFAETVGSSA